MRTTKSEMIDVLVSSKVWSGTKDKKMLLKNYSYAEIKDLYSELENAEYEYFENIYS